MHFEIDVPNPTATLPVGTTAELAIDVGEPVPATEMPLAAATVRGDKATVFVVDGRRRAKRGRVAVLGEAGGTLFLEPTLPPGSAGRRRRAARCSTTATRCVERPARSRAGGRRDRALAAATRSRS